MIADLFGAMQHVFWSSFPGLAYLFLLRADEICEQKCEMKWAVLSDALCDTNLFMPKITSNPQNGAGSREFVKQQAIAPCG